MTEVIKIEGTVTKIRKDKKGVQLNDEDWFSGFSEMTCDKGDELEIEYVINGQWKNINKWRVISKFNGGMSTEKINFEDKPKKQNKGNMASFIMSYVKDLVIAEKVKYEDFALECSKMMSIYEELSGA